MAFLLELGFPGFRPPLGILHNRRSTEYNKNFGGCKGRKLEPATPSSKESRHQAAHQQLADAGAVGSATPKSGVCG